jgi:2,7-dihydroxy-5-methyl-1-naphthoate 7-O-methyltransferase
MSDATHVDFEALTDLCTPWCLHVVATLGVADHLAAGRSSIDALASRCGADAESLHRVMRHLVHRGVFEEPASGEFALNAASRGLLGEGARWLNLDGLGGRMARAWSGLLTAVRTGGDGYHEVFGCSFWEDLDAHPDIAASFDALMGPAGHGTPDSHVLLNDDWSSVRTVVDVGGGTGSLLAEILRAHPTVRGTLVDLPRTVARSQEIFETAGVSDRVTLVGQSFFDPLPPGGDMYTIKNLLADWPDREAHALLKRCAEAARPTGRVVVIGGVTPDEHGPAPELLMLVLVGGKSRTLTEFQALAQAAGLTVTATGRQPSGRFVVECRPA